MYLLHRIEELTYGHNDARRAIGEYVLEHHGDLDSYTIAQIADATFTSKPSVTRFAKALGFSGWREFIRAFMAEEHRRQKDALVIDANVPFGTADSPRTIANNLGDLMAESLADTYANLDMGAVGQAARLIDKAERVLVFGQPPNGYVAQLFCRKLVTIGHSAQAFLGLDNGISARVAGPNDCAVLISYAGNNPLAPPMLYLPTLKANGVPTVALTSEGTTYLRQEALCTLTISSHEDLFRKIGNFATETSILYLLNVLFGCVFARHYQHNLAYKVKTAQELEAERRGSDDLAAWEDSL